MNVPAVSVIMNCLNSARDLRAALDSLMAQSFEDFEVIFWDNGSTDDSPAIARSYGPRLRYFRGEKTVPLGAARNLALAQARGRYLAFLDCDDLWRPQKLEKQVALFEANERVGLVCT
ncbi:MAG: glycosyltransferase, partial [Desulfovibrio sp.]|uniref:glycosyltransferase family 2 protein n=1 Tax=Desulfovibrio sp. TaxID=885 RepID=UPI002588C784